MVSEDEISNIEEEFEEDDEAYEFPPKRVPCPHHVVMKHGRYWFNAREMEVVRQIQKQFPNNWEDIILERMRRRQWL